MLSRHALLARLCCSVVLFAAAACQATPDGGAKPAAMARPAAVVPATDSPFDNVVWARIPYCACLDGVATDNVSAALERAQLPGTVQTLSPTNGWMYFVVGYDPATASREQIATAIADGGGEVMAGPP